MVITRRVSPVAMIAGGHKLLTFVIPAAHILPQATLGRWPLVRRPAPALEIV